MAVDPFTELFGPRRSGYPIRDDSCESEHWWHGAFYELNQDVERWLEKAYVAGIRGVALDFYSDFSVDPFHNCNEHFPYQLRARQLRASYNMPQDTNLIALDPIAAKEVLSLWPLDDQILPELWKSWSRNPPHSHSPYLVKTPIPRPNATLHGYLR